MRKVLPILVLIVILATTLAGCNRTIAVTDFAPLWEERTGAFKLADEYSFTAVFEARSVENFNFEQRMWAKDINPDVNNQWNEGRLEAVYSRKGDNFRITVTRSGETFTNTVIDEYNWRAIELLEQIFDPLPSPKEALWSVESRGWFGQQVLAYRTFYVAEHLSGNILERGEHYVPFKLSPLAREGQNIRDIRFDWASEWFKDDPNEPQLQMGTVWNDTLAITSRRGRINTHQRAWLIHIGA